MQFILDFFFPFFGGEGEGATVRSIFQDVESVEGIVLII